MGQFNESYEQECKDLRAELVRWRRITATPGHEDKALTPETLTENLLALCADVERLGVALAAATRRAEVAERKVERVKRAAISEKAPFLDRSEPPENENYNCGKWDAARAILAAIGGSND